MCHVGVHPIAKASRNAMKTGYHAWRPLPSLGVAPGFT